VSVRSRRFLPSLSLSFLFQVSQSRTRPCTRRPVQYVSSSFFYFLRVCGGCSSDLAGRVNPKLGSGLDSCSFSLQFSARSLSLDFSPHAVKGK